MPLEPIDLPQSFYLGEYVSKRRARIALWGALGMSISAVSVMTLIPTLGAAAMSGARPLVSVRALAVVGAGFTLGCAIALLGQRQDMRFIRHCIRARTCHACSYAIPGKHATCCPECGAASPYIRVSTLSETPPTPR